VRYAGIVGLAPVYIPGPVQSDSFERLTRFVGNMEQAGASEYPALHAACHALMNGVDRVIFAGVEDPIDEQQWVEALKRLFKSDPLAVVVAPGGPPAALSEAFCALPYTRQSCLWLDSDPGDHDGRIRAAPQIVPTTSPGRRSMEALPATALIAPLHLGTTTALRGVHQRPTTRGLLKTDARGHIVLTEALDPPGPRLPPRPVSHHSSVEFRINAAVAHMAEPIVLTESVTPQLYKRLAREATSIMEGFRKSGDVTAYSVRCDEATSEGSPSPVVEIHFKEPRRVTEVVLQVGQLSEP